MDDARLCLAVLQTAAQHGAVIANYVEAMEFEKAHGRIAGVWASDRVAGKRFHLQCRVVLNAAGPGADDVCQMAGETGEPRLQPTKGVHVITSSRGHHTAWLLLHPHDGRVFFVIPWYGKTLIGTTDTFPDPAANALQVQPEEITYLLDGYNHHFDPGISTTDVMGTFAGLRPLIRAGPGSPSSMSREFRIDVGASGLVTALGGKFTTFRSMAETIMDFLGEQIGGRRRCGTRELYMHSVPDIPWPKFVADTTVSISNRYPIAMDSALHLIHRYGDRVELVLNRIAATTNGFERIHSEEPDLFGEQAWQRTEEMAITVDDLLLRRSRIGMWRPELLTPSAATTSVQ